MDRREFALVLARACQQGWLDEGGFERIRRRERESPDALPMELLTQAGGLDIGRVDAILRELRGAAPVPDRRAPATEDRADVGPNPTRLQSTALPGPLAEPDLTRRDVGGPAVTCAENSPPAPSPARPLTETRLPPAFGRYRPIGRLGEGGMGVVLEAVHEATGRVAAVKLIHPQFLSAAEATERFRREMRSVAALHHENVVAILDVGTEAGIPYYVMERLAGRSLHEILRSGRIDPERAVRLALGAARGLAHAHEHGIVHRDIKPSNLLIVPGEGDVERAVLIDFGLARLLDAQPLTRSEELLGTPAYMSPEQASGEARAVGPQTDVYSLGAALYEAVTGEMVHKADSPLALLADVIYKDPIPPRRHLPGLPRDLETILLKSLEKDPTRRYAGASALAADLAAFLEGMPIAARPVGPFGALVRRARRHRGVTAVALAAALLLAVAGAVGAVGKLRDLERIRKEYDRAVAAEEAAHVARGRAEEERDRARRRAGAQDLVMEAVRLAGAGADSALISGTFRAAREADPSYHGTFQQWGRWRSGRGEHESAREDLEHALERKPDDGLSLYYLFLTLEWLGRSEAERTSVLERLAALDGGGELACWARARRARRQAQAATDAAGCRAALESARDLLDQAIRHSPRLARAWVDRGMVLAELGRAGRGTADVKRALEIEPDDPMAHAALGAVLLLDDRPAEAEAPLDRAILLDPHRRQSWGDRAALAWLQGRVRHAAADVAVAIRGKDPAPRHLALAVRTALECGDPAEARARSTRGLESHPNDPDVLEAAVWERLASGDAAGALGLAERRLVLRPEDPKGYRLKARALLDSGRPEAAEAELDKALARAEAWSSFGGDIGRERAHALADLAGCRLHAGRIQEATLAARRSVAACRTIPEPHRILARTLCRQGEETAARAELAEALRLGIDPIETWRVSAEVEAVLAGPRAAAAVLADALGRHPGASRLRDALARIDPVHPALAGARDGGRAAREAGLAALAQRDIDAAGESLRRAVADGPEDAANHEALGRWEMERKAFEAAAESFRRAIARDPRRTSPYRELSRALRALERWEEALETLNRALRLEPKATLYEARGLVHARLGRTPEAIADFGQAIAASPKSPTPYLNRANAYYNASDYVSSLADYEQVLALDPTQTKALAGRGGCLFALGRLEAAIRDWEEYLARAPESDVSVQVRAWLEKAREAGKAK